MKTKNKTNCHTFSKEAQDALNMIQSLSVQEEHQWSEEEIETLITDFRKKKGMADSVSSEIE